MTVRRLLCLVALAMTVPTVARAQTGFLKLTAPVDTMLVVVDDDLVNFHRIASGDSLELPTGQHRITVASKRSLDFLYRPTIQAGRTLTTAVPLQVRQPGAKPDIGYIGQSSYPRLVWGGNLLIVTDHDSDIYLNDRRVGRGQAKLDTTAGVYQIRTEHAVAGSTKRRVAVRRDRLWVTEMFNRPERAAIRRASLIPGGGQRLKGESRKARLMLGAAIVGTFGIATGVSILTPREGEADRAATDQLLARYRQSRSSAEATQLGVELERRANALKPEIIRQKVGIYGGIGLLAGAYLWSLADAWWVAPEGGYRDPSVDSRVILAPFMAQSTGGLRLQVTL